MEILIDQQTKASKLRDEYVKRVIKTDMEIIQRLHKNLQYVADKIDEKSQNLENPLEEEMFLKFIGEARMITEQYLKWGSKMKIVEDTEDIEKKVMKCIEDFPPDLIQKFIQRWEEYEHSSKIS